MLLATPECNRKFQDHEESIYVLDRVISQAIYGIFDLFKKIFN